MPTVTLAPLFIGALSQDRKIEVFRGDSLKVKIAVRTSTGDAFDLSGGVVQWRVAYGSLSPVTKLRKLTGEGIELSGGLMVITVDPIDTREMEIGQYYHEMRMTKGEEILTNMSGLFLVKRNLGFGEHAMMPRRYAHIPLLRRKRMVMATRLVVRNVEAANKAGETVQESVVIKRTGGGPVQQQNLMPGQEVEVTVDRGQKVQISAAGDTE